MPDQQAVYLLHYFMVKFKLDENAMPSISLPTRPHSPAPTIKKEVTVRLLLVMNYIHI